SHEVVREYMAHHQGMILVALANHFSSSSMVQRFHADPHIRSVELLLQEQIPYNAPVENPHSEDAPAIRPARPRSVTIPWRVRVRTLQPRVHFLSNGRYGALITASGAGYSTWNEIDLTRWRADSTLNDWGAWLYIQDMVTGELWSAGFQPAAVQPGSRDVYFNAHLAEFRRQDQDISAVMEITVAAEDDVEIRQVSLVNLGNRPRRLRLVTYGEVVLAAQAADARHPAFNKLFIESEWIGELNALLFRRRPRSEDEPPVYLIHAAVVEEGRTGDCTYESSRATFVGRNRTPRLPAALDGARPLANTSGAPLDPLFSISQEIELDPHGSARVAFLTLAAASRPEALALAERYRPAHVIERAFEQARFSAEAELRQLGLTTIQVERIDRLLSLLLYPHPALRARPEVLAANTIGQPGLWGYSISGDYPILLARISDPEQLSLVHELLQAHAYWRNRQLKIDLVLLNTQGTDYGQELNGQIYRLLARSGADAWLNRRGGIFLLFADRLSEAEHILLGTVARAILDGEKGSLADQVASIGRLPPRLPAFIPSQAAEAEAEATTPVARPADLRFDNGLGGFSPDGREYIVYLEPGQSTPAPWINVIANPDFGFLVSESGSGYTWSLNSGENRLTPWSNDPVSDPPGEALYLRDEETAEVWSPTPLPSPAGAPYLVRHGAGYSIFEHASHGLKQRLRLFAAPDAPLKIVQLRLENTWDRARRITATYYVEWVLGVTRETSQQFVVSEFDSESQALLARNAYLAEFGERVAFAAANKPLHGLTADRTEFLGRMGSRARPAALGRIGLASMVEAGQDPCAALQLHIDLQPGEVGEIYFLLGQEAGRAEAVNLVHQFQEPARVEEAWQALNASWEGLLNTVTVHTPDPAMDLLLNRWLLYQTLSCRLWGRSAFYQSSGAYGFRDQLQDVMALVFAAPQLARQHILLAAGRQFETGDVLHWWHPPSGRGVRTRISDDLLWLPFVT
ncbi:MAG TPA: hypothetical protein VF498_10490, partial [Anaerolineales bacterium]